jgi:hypothetical protein
MGALLRQAPAGNGNTNLEPEEYVELTNPLTGLGEEVALHQTWQLGLHPNPFNPSVAVLLFMPQAQEVKVEVFDPAGKRIASLFDGLASPGPLLLSWDGRDGQGAACASGVYIFRARGPQHVLLKKGMLLK